MAKKQAKPAEPTEAAVAAPAEAPLQKKKTASTRGQGPQEAKGR